MLQQNLVVLEDQNFLLIKLQNQQILKVVNSNLFSHIYIRTYYTMANIETGFPKKISIQS
jgi:hypothetical protein